MMFNRSQPQGKIQLVASAVAQPFNSYVLFVSSNRYQDRSIVIPKTSSQTGMVAKCEMREEITCPAQDWPLMFLAKGLDCAVEHSGRDPKAQILRNRRVNPR